MEHLGKVLPMLPIMDSIVLMLMVVDMGQSWEKDVILRQILRMLCAFADEVQFRDRYFLQAFFRANLLEGRKVS